MMKCGLRQTAAPISSMVGMRFPTFTDSLWSPGLLGSSILGFSATRKLTTLRGTMDTWRVIPFPPPNAPEVLVLYRKRAG